MEVKDVKKFGKLGFITGCFTISLLNYFLLFFNNPWVKIIFAIVFITACMYINNFITIVSYGLSKDIIKQLERVKK